MNTRGFTLIELIVVMAIVLLAGSLTLPMVGRALEAGRASKCRANLRAMSQAVGVYAAEHDGAFPPALVTDGGVSKGWDFFIEGSGEHQTVEPGWIWREYGANEILQCPSYRGSDNWQGERHTGYNYNTSYLGGMRTVMRGHVLRDTPSSTLLQVRAPAQTALFGDGEFAGGANKFMRSPKPGKLDRDFSGRHGGTQGYRHNGHTHVVFVDGHVEARKPIDTTTGFKGVAEGTGFLSADNSMYDLE